MSFVSIGIFILSFVAGEVLRDPSEPAYAMAIILNVSFFAAAAGLILSLIGLIIGNVRKGTAKGKALAGLIVSALQLVLSAFVLVLADIAINWPY